MKLNKILLFLLVLLVGISTVNATADYPYDVANATYTGWSLSVSAQETTPYGVEFNTDGSKMFMLGQNTNDRVNEYDCSVNFNVTSCIYSTRYFDFSAQADVAYGMTFNDIGSKVYIIDPLKDKTFQYDCTTNYKMDTCTYSGLSLTVSGQDTFPVGADFNDDGSKFYMTGWTNNKVYEYGCTTDYKIDTCSYSTRFLLTTSQDGTPVDSNFNDDGSLIFVLGTDTDSVYQYECTTNYKVDTCTYSNRFLSVTSQENTPNGFTFNNDGSSFYVIGQANDRVYQYSIDFPLPILTFTNITVNSETLINNLAFNTTTNLFETFVLNSSTNGDVTHSYSIDGASFINYTTDNLNGSVNITQAQGSYNISFCAENNQTSVCSSNFSYIIDTTLPTINNSIPSEINTYDFDGSLFSCTDINLLSCNISIDGFNKASGVNFTLTHNGNLSYNITTTDLAGNSNTDSGVLLINPPVLLSINSGGSPLTNYTFGGRSDVNGTVTYTIYNDSLIIGNNTLLFEKSGYSSQSFTFELNTTSIINQTFNVSQSSINLQIKDKSTGTIISGVNFSVEFVATVGLSTSTTNGTLTVTNTLFQDESYRVIVSSANYQTESIFFNFSNKEQLNLDVFMILKNDTQLGTVFIKAVDRFSQPIEGAIVQALQWDSTTSTSIKVSEGKTGKGGLAPLNIILDDELYQFSAEFGGVIGYSVENIIDSAQDGVTITIVISSESTDQSYDLQDLVYSVDDSFNNATNVSTITVTWMDLQGLPREICINQYRVIATTSTLVNEDCATPDDAGVFPKSYFINVSYTTVLKVEIKNDDGTFLSPALDSFTFQPTVHPSKMFADLGLDIFIIPLLFLMSIAAGLYLENVLVGTIALIFSSGISLLIAPGLITGGVVAFLFYLGWLTINYGVKPR